MVNLPYPSTLQLNRFYTVEFYQMVRSLLAEEGVLVVTSPGSLSYLSDALRDLNLVAYDTLSAVYPSVRPIPGEATLWLASPSPRAFAEPLEALAGRWMGRSLDTRLLTPEHIRLRLDPRYLEWFWSSLDAGPGSPGSGALLPAGVEGRDLPGQAGQPAANRDLHPQGLFYGLAYWNALFSPGVARALRVAKGLKLWMLVLPLFAVTLVLAGVARRTRRGKAAAVPLAVAATGFTGMTADLMVIFAFQSFYGYVYHWIGLLITAFMAGLALGSWLVSRRLARSGGQARQGLALFVRLEGALVLFWILLPLLLVVLYQRVGMPASPITSQALLFLLNALAGFLVGAQFPVANHLWLRDREGMKGSTGVLYAADLAGAFVAAVLVSVLLLPVLGIVASCLFAAALKLATLSLLVISARP
jgi:spermidine synthase